eukprot:5809957-Amphidinium_carterae.1
MKIATVVNNLQGNISENLIMRINQTTTLDDVHQWISNYFNSTYTGTEGDNRRRGQFGGVSNYDNENYDNEEYNEAEYDEKLDYDNNDLVTILRSSKAKREDKALKGKVKEKETTETIAKEKMEGQLHATLAESKDTHRHFATTTKARVEKARTKAVNNHPTTHNSLGKAIHNHHLINKNTTLNRRRHNIHLLHLNLRRATTKAMGNFGTKEARKVNKFQCIKSTTMTTTSRKTHMPGTTLGVRNGIQKEMPIHNGLYKKLDKFFNNN